MSVQDSINKIMSVLLKISKKMPISHNVVS